MTNSKTLFDNLVRDLKLNQPPDEKRAIAFEVFSHFGIARTEILGQKRIDFDYSTLLPIIKRLNQDEPVQYVLGEAWFCGHQYIVNPAVLIPRPETELLVEEAVSSFSENDRLAILDIGTGSGCIAISLALMFPKATLHAIDISEEALRVARQNADRHQVKINFFKHDILKGPVPDLKFDLIVSNPPYISGQEKKDLEKNVVDYEPHIALFAHESDPLVFYKAIAAISRNILNPGGIIMAELNPKFEKEVVNLFTDLGCYSCTKKDFSGQSRLLISHC